MKKYIIPETTIIHVNPSPLLTGSTKNNGNISVVVDETGSSGDPTITVSTEDNPDVGFPSLMMQKPGKVVSAHGKRTTKLK